jgi:YfiH family protein
VSAPVIGPPRLARVERAGVGVLEDRGARRRGVLVAFTERHGGVSPAPFDTLNLSARPGDARARVDENRRRAGAAAGFAAGDLVLARQVHGAELLEAGPRARGVLGEADALVARRPGPVLGILTADCAPVIVAGDAGVAIVHAGWRGLVAGVVARGARAVGRAWGAWVGPSIRACCYVVGGEVAEAFAGAGLPVAAPDRVDPGAAAEAALLRAGVRRVASSRECTSCSPRFFSHRRDGVTGRQGAFAALLTP